jgi:hypothetical protein
MLNPGRKAFVGAHTTLVVVVALVAAVVCLAAVASAGTRSAEAQEEEVSPRATAAAGGKEKTHALGDGNPIIYKRVDSRPGFAGGPYEHKIECPEGYNAIGGGFDLNNPGNKDWNNNYWQIYESFPYKGDTWSVVAYGHTPYVTNTLPTFTAYAACAPEELLSGFRYTWVEDRRVWPNETTMIWSKCESDERAIAGGFRFSSGVKLVRNERSREDERSWGTGAKLINNDKGIHFLSSTAVCVSRGALEDTRYLEAQDTSRSAPADSRAVANTKSCPQGTYLLSGGAGVSDGTNALWSNSSPPHQGAQSWKASAIAKEKDGWFDFKPITVHAFALCGRFADQPGAGDGKLSGKNPGWGDGMGGGRFK